MLVIKNLLIIYTFQRITAVFFQIIKAKCRMKGANMLYNNKFPGYPGMPRAREDEEYPFEVDELSAVASSTECTGLVQAVPEDEDEAESYRQLINVPIKPYKNKATRKCKNGDKRARSGNKSDNV